MQEKKVEYERDSETRYLGSPGGRGCAESVGERELCGKEDQEGVLEHLWGGGDRGSGKRDLSAKLGFIMQKIWKRGERGCGQDVNQWWDAWNTPLSQQ